MGVFEEYLGRLFKVGPDLLYFGPVYPKTPKPQNPLSGDSSLLELFKKNTFQESIMAAEGKHERLSTITSPRDGKLLSLQPLNSLAPGIFRAIPTLN